MRQKAPRTVYVQLKPIALITCCSTTTKGPDTRHQTRLKDACAVAWESWLISTKMVFVTCRGYFYLAYLFGFEMQTVALSLKQVCIDHPMTNRKHSGAAMRRRGQTSFFNTRKGGVRTTPL